MTTNPRQELRLTSPAFAYGGLIPRKYTEDGENASPPLEWTGTPEGTQSLVLIATDPDIPSGRLHLLTWPHWIVYNIPPHVTALPEGLPTQAVLDNGASQGVGGLRRQGYRGPRPPFGTHRYFFRLYALDVPLDLLPAQATLKRVEQAMEGHVLATAELMGRYGRHA